MLQIRFFWSEDNSYLATLPMALLTAIVRKEALLPEHTAAFAATQLLPIIQAATDRNLALSPPDFYHPYLCKELLVSADTPSQTAAAACTCRIPHAIPMGTCTLCLHARSAKHGWCALQVMCSTLATSSAWPVLMGYRDLITVAADMVLVTYSKGDVMPISSLCVFAFRFQLPCNPHARHCLSTQSPFQTLNACGVSYESLTPSAGSSGSPFPAPAVSEEAAAAVHLARPTGVHGVVTAAGLGVHPCGGV